MVSSLGYCPQFLQGKLPGGHLWRATAGFFSGSALVEGAASGQLAPGSIRVTFPCSVGQSCSHMSRPCQHLLSATWEPHEYELIQKRDPWLLYPGRHIQVSSEKRCGVSLWFKQIVPSGSCGGLVSSSVK